MGSECCKLEKNPEKELYTLETIDTEMSHSKFYSSTINSIKKKYKHLNANLKKLLIEKLKLKFKIKEKYILLEEITISEFESILSKNIYFGRILTNLSEELNKIEYEEDNILYGNIAPIKIFIKNKGDIQYYQGSFNSKGETHGKGIWIKNNNIYYGNFSNDKFNGNGLYINSKGNYYFGEWKNNKIEGKGEIIIDGIESYKGNFKENKKNGKGVENYKNYDVYIGDFKENQKNETGKYIFSNGDIYKGDFINSKIEGEGKIKFNDGKIYEGNFKNGKINGKGELNYNNGIKFKGEFKENKKEGIGEYNWPNGMAFKGKWKNDIPIEKGIFEDFTYDIFEEIIYENGVIKE